MAFIAENVKGLLSANKGEAFPLIVSEFENAGYSVKYRLLNAAEFGVPQNRLRVFIIGIRNDIDVNFEFPEPTYFQEGTLFDKSFIPLKEVIFLKVR